MPPTRSRFRWSSSALRRESSRSRALWWCTKGLVAALILADEDLDRAGPVAKLEEVDLSLAAAEHDPAGDAHDRPLQLGPRAFGKSERTNAGDRLMPIEALAPGIVAQGLDLLELL